MTNLLATLVDQIGHILAQLLSTFRFKRSGPQFSQNGVVHNSASVRDVPPTGPCQCQHQRCSALLAHTTLRCCGSACSRSCPCTCRLMNDAQPAPHTDFGALKGERSCWIQQLMIPALFCKVLSVPFLFHLFQSCICVGSRIERLPARLCVVQPGSKKEIASAEKGCTDGNRVKRIDLVAHKHRVSRCPGVADQKSVSGKPRKQPKHS